MQIPIKRRLGCLHGYEEDWDSEEEVYEVAKGLYVTKKTDLKAYQEGITVRNVSATSERPSTYMKRGWIEQGTSDSSWRLGTHLSGIQRKKAKHQSRFRDFAQLHPPS